jgi:hypothetical protein
MKADSIDERRRSARKAHHIPVLVTVTNSSRVIPKRIAAVTVNASQDGLFLHVPHVKNLEVGEDVTIEVLPEEGAEGVKSPFIVCLKGRIVRIESQHVAVSLDKSTDNGE